MAPITANTIAGKYGNVYFTANGTAPPFTIPPSASFDANTLTLPAAWTAGNLGYLHEDDTPEMGFDISVEPIKSWQTGGNPIRMLQTGRVRTMKFTAREVNKSTWGLVEPSTTYTAGAAGSSTATITNSAVNPDKAALFEVQDLDYGVKLWVYVPRITVTDVGAIKWDRKDTANIQFSTTFLSPTGQSTDPLYYIGSNHPGLQ